MTGRSPTIWRRASSARASRSRSTTCSARATPSCPACCAAGWAARASADRRDLGQCLRRVRRVAPALLAGVSDLRGAAVLPEERQPAPRAAQGRGDQPHPLGDDAPARCALADGVRHATIARSSRISPSDAGADASKIAAFKVLAVKAAARVADGRDGYGMLLDESTAAQRHVRIRPASLLLARPPGRAAGLAAACASSSARTSARSWSNGRSTTALKCLCFYHPDDPAAAEAGAAGEAARVVRGRAQGRTRTAGRDHRRQARPARRRHGSRARCTSSMRSASSPTGGSWSRSPRAAAWRATEAADHRGNDPSCRRRACCSASTLRQDELEPAFAATANAPIVKGFAVGPHHLRRRGARSWLAGELGDEAAIADMARRFETLTAAWLAARGRKAA